MKHIITLLLVCLLANFTSASMMGPWDMEKLSQVPQWEKTDKVAKPGMTGILYSSIPYKGKPVQVFAYYNAPEGAPPKGGWPAVVCVHGGGGTAFNDWVQRWNDHGYAAISMDLEGHYPITNTEGRSGQRRLTENPGPSRVGVFGDFEKPIDQQWYYHAVAQVVLAHSLIRSFQEVNSDKIGITGISWGGTLTSTVMGVDNRFKFAIPVYGCGFLPDSDGHQGQAIKPGPQTDLVNKHYDGSAYFNNVTIPTLWVNGTNDKHFTMPITQKSSQAVQGSATLRYQLEMPHGHSPGWRPEDIYAFADSIVKDGMPLVQFSKPQVKGDQAVVEFSSITKVTKAEFLYTLDTMAWPSRKWKAVPAAVAGSMITATIPEGTVALYFNATDKRGFMASSEFVLVGQNVSSQEQDHYPKFSWNHVPLYMHMRKSKAFTQEEFEYLAKFPIITLEKTTGMETYGSTEQGSLEAAKGIKAINPDAKILYYRNIIVHYNGYDVNKSLSEVDTPLLMNAAGKTNIIHAGKRGGYDLTSSSLQSWWLDHCITMAAHAEIDGIFVDGNIKVLEPAFLKKEIGQEKKAEVTQVYGQMMGALKSRIGKEKLVIANILRARLSNSGLDYIEYFDGSYLEGIESAANGMTRPDYVAKGIAAIQKAARDGKIICFSTGLGKAKVTGMGIDDTRRKAGQGSAVQNRLTYTLAMFLICAEKYSYFLAHDGYSVNRNDSSVWLKDFPEYSKPLGPPQGPAKKEGYIYSREYEHASVWLDLEHEKARIEWRSGS